MASRHCFASLPAHLQDLPQVPRLGPLGRAGSELDVASAGHLFPLGEHDCRTAPTIDRIPGKRQCRQALFGSPQPEPRVCDIDLNQRRAASAPPTAEMTRQAQSLALHAFGVLPDIDEKVYGRRQCMSPKPTTATRQESARRALCNGDIEGVLSKKHFCGAMSPRRSPSLQGTDLMKGIDIDARVGSCKRMSPAKTPSKGILPMDSPSYSMTCPANFLASPRVSPRGRSYNYFEESLSAERYAKLIGRPHVGTDKPKGLRRMNLALELERREKFNLGLINDMEMDKESLVPSSAISTTASECSTPMLSAWETGSTKRSLNDARAIASQLQELEIIQSKGMSEEKLAALRSDLEDQKLSSLHKRALAEGADEDDMATVLDATDQKEGFIQLILAKVTEKAQNHPGAMPLALRRVVASLLPNEERMTEDMAQDLRTAVRASAQTIHKSQGTRSMRKCNYSPRLSPRQQTNFANSSTRSRTNFANSSTQSRFSPCSGGFSPRGGGFSPRGGGFSPHGGGFSPRRGGQWTN